MLDIQTCFKTIRRPKLLMQAARHNLQRYDRSRHLARLLHIGSVHKLGPTETLLRLMEEERSQNEQREQKMAGYEISHHILVLTAILFELGQL